MIYDPNEWCTSRRMPDVLVFSAVKQRRNYATNIVQDEKINACVRRAFDAYFRLESEMLDERLKVL